MIAHMWAGDVWGVVGAVVMLGLLVLIVLAIASLLRGSGQAGPRGGSPALRLLAERYARGEITREEFTERRDVLSRAPGDGP